MRRLRAAVSRAIGIVQCILGIATSVLAYLAYASQSVRETLSINDKEVFLTAFLLLIFAAFSLLSGMILIGQSK